jgi:hypothetical protein
MFKGRTVSLTRLDQLATPLRRNGEHISAILERERKHANDIETMSRLSLSRGSPTHGSPASTNDIRKSRSMSQLAGTVRQPYKLRNKSGSRSPMNGLVSGGPMRKSDTSKSMSQLDREDRKMAAAASNSTAAVMRSRKARSERLRQQVKEHLNGSSIGGSTASSAGANSHKTKIQSKLHKLQYKTKVATKSISKFLASLILIKNINISFKNNKKKSTTIDQENKHSATPIVL